MDTMKTTIFVVIISFFISILACCPSVNAGQDKNDISKAEYINGVYIPKNLEEAWAEIEKNLSPEDRQKLRTIPEGDTIMFHFSSGMGMRNNWGLWGGSRLAKYFNDLGVFHPDDMSSIILETLWCHINDKPIRLDERVAFFKEFWLRRSEPTPESFPEKDLWEVGAQDYPTPQGEFVGYIRVYKSSTTGNAWLYEYNLGWKRLKDDFLEKYPHWKDTLKKQNP